MEHPLCNTTRNEDSITTSAQIIVEQLSSITRLQIIENLSLLGNQLSHLPNNFTESIANLVHLDLSGNRLNNLPDSINMLKMLTYLSLDNNQFVSLPNVVCELSSLKTLKAHQNCIRYVPNNLENLSNLQDLDLSFNQLKYLPNSCTNLHQLRNLFLASNRFKIIPNCVADGMENLQKFDFSQNSYSELNVSPKSNNLNTFYAENNGICPLFPNWILSSKYNNLETVSLNNTRFKEYCLPKSPSRSYIKKLFMMQCELFGAIVEQIISEMTNLEELKIGNTKYSYMNDFWTMPIEKLKEPFNLTKIDLHNTGIFTVSNTISKFVNLSVIDISCNNISYLPEEICSLKNLCNLTIHKNKLTTLPNNIGEMIWLKELKVSYNYLYELPESIGDLSNLQYLDLYDNEFEVLPETIENLPNLLGVDLEQNYFSTDSISERCAKKCGGQFDFDINFHILKGRLDLNKEYLYSCLGSFYKFTKFHSNLEVPLPEGPLNQLENERWDTSEDSADEFDPCESKEPRTRVYSPFTFYKPLQQVYCPADYHQPRVITRVAQMLKEGTLVWSSKYEEGQFEDS